MKEEIPHYYIGKTHKYEARKIAEDFELTYNLGSCLKYILRAGKKEGNPTANDIRKAINHLHFELDIVCSNTKTITGGLAETGARS